MVLLVSQSKVGEETGGKVAGDLTGADFRLPPATDFRSTASNFSGQPSNSQVMNSLNSPVKGDSEQRGAAPHFKLELPEIPATGQNRPPSSVGPDGVADYTIPRLPDRKDPGTEHLVREAAALGISLVPLVGDAYDYLSLLFKRDLLTGQKYSDNEIALGLVIASIGAGSPISATAALKAAQKLKPKEVDALITEARRALDSHHLKRNKEASKFGSPFYGTPELGYHVDPPHPGGAARHGQGGDRPHVDFHDRQEGDKRQSWRYGRVFFNDRGEVEVAMGPFN